MKKSMNDKYNLLKSQKETKVPNTAVEAELREANEQIQMLQRNFNKALKSSNYNNCLKELQ